MIFIYSEFRQAQNWLQHYQGKKATFACILGFTATSLIPDISAAGATPKDREFTAIADGEFLIEGAEVLPKNPLPYLAKGISPVFITRAIVESCGLPTYLFDAGLIHKPIAQAINLGGMPAKCISSGKALNYQVVQHLFKEGMKWGKKLSFLADYLIIGECVVGGTTTALAVLSGLGVNALGMVNSSHPQCNHEQKWAIVSEGLQNSGLDACSPVDPFAVIAAVGDPMQIVAAGMAISASSQGGVVLAGGTQMLAVYALIKRIVAFGNFSCDLKKILVGTTRWVAEDKTGDTVKLAQEIGQVPLLATGLNFSTSKYPGFRVYESGYVKEGVGAGGCAIYAHLAANKKPLELLTITEEIFFKYRNLMKHRNLRFNSIS